MATSDMREMFANLVAHACDKRMESAIHPAFVNILAQISPIEAKILSDFRPKQELKIGASISVSGSTEDTSICAPELSGTGIYSFPERVQPIANYYLVKTKQFFWVQANVIKSEVATIEKVSSAITNLVRLGLIETDFWVQSTEKDAYEYFFQNDLYETLQKGTHPGNQAFLRSIRGNMIIGGEHRKIKVEKGIVRLT